mgnify:CR=1 FL=1
MDRTGQRIAGDAALSAPGKSVFRAGLLCRRVFSGQIQTLVSRISYQADCVLAGSGLTGTFHTASGDYSIVGEAFGPESTLSEETT